MIKELICISCPQGCHLTAEFDNDPKEAKVSGNRCPRGVVYAVSELTDPRRTVTAVVPTTETRHPVLPVRTNEAFPKDKIPQLLNMLYKMQIELPISCGDVIVKDALGTGIDVVAAENRF